MEPTTTANVMDDGANKETPTTMPGPPSAGGGGNDDLISGLDDDVLLHILKLVADAKDVVRTGALSRRWRDLWTRAHVLMFDDEWPELESAGDVQAYVAFVSNVLARRARSEEGLELLAIPLDMNTDQLAASLLEQSDQLVAPAVEAAEAWIRYAVRHPVTYFSLKLGLPRKPLTPFSLVDIEELERQIQSLRDDEAGLDVEEVDGRDAEVADEEDDEEEDQVAEVADEDDDEEDQVAKVADDDDSYDEEYIVDDDDEENELYQSLIKEGGDDQEETTPVIDLEDLPSSANLKAMRLDLDIVVGVRLPSTAAFTSLKYLEIELVKLDTGSGDLLSRLLSSACCPRLQNLELSWVEFKRCGTKRLVLDNEALLDVSLEDMRGIESLELKTPNLLHLQIKSCRQLESVTVSAPGLEELAFLHNHSPADVHVVGENLPCVWGLKVDLTSHGEIVLCDRDMNDARIRLMQRCTSTTDLVVHMYIPEAKYRGIDMIKDKIPELPHVTSLAVHVHPMTERHSFGDGVAGLLTRFDNLRYLGLTMDEVLGYKKQDELWSEEDDRDLASFTCDHQDHWESSSMSFVHLQQAEFRGLTGTDCELRFLQSVLASATDIQKVNISFSVNYSLEGRMDEFQQKLLPHGTWAAACSHDGYSMSYEWSPGPEEESLDVHVSDWILDWPLYY